MGLLMRRESTQSPEETPTEGTHEGKLNINQEQRKKNTLKHLISRKYKNARLPARIASVTDDSDTTVLARSAKDCHVLTPRLWAMAMSSYWWRQQMHYFRVRLYQYQRVYVTLPEALALIFHLLTNAYAPWFPWSSQSNRVYTQSPANYGICDPVSLFPLVPG